MFNKFKNKYKLTHHTKGIAGHTLYQIKALKDFGDVKKGDLGGWIENSGNLSQTGTAWVYGEAKVFDNAKVYGNAHIYDRAWIYSNAQVYGNAMVCGNADIYGDTRVYGNAMVYGSAIVCDNARIYGNSDIQGNINIRENDEIKDNKSYLIFKNTWSSGREFIFILSNHRWHVGCFDGTGEELIKKAYADSEVKGKMYELYVNFAEQVVKTQQQLKEM